MPLHLRVGGCPGDEHGSYISEAQLITAIPRGITRDYREFVRVYGWG